MANIGMLHVHSNLSYDGPNMLAQIASRAESRGYRFVKMSQHSDPSEPKKLTYLVNECWRRQRVFCRRDQSRTDNQELRRKLVRLLN